MRVITGTFTMHLTFPFTFLFHILLSNFPSLSTTARLSRPLLLRLPPGFINASSPGRFGQGLAISSDARKLLLGAPGTYSDAGSAHIFTRRASLSGYRSSQWIHQRILRHSTWMHSTPPQTRRPLIAASFGSAGGFSVGTDASARNFVTGAPGTQLGRGSVVIFDENWNVRQILSAPQRQVAGDAFGCAVAVDEDCENIIVGARGRRGFDGGAFIYSCETHSANCTLNAELAPVIYADAPGPHGVRLRNNFGSAVGISKDGKVAVVGCPGAEAERGSAMVYKRNEHGKWSLFETLKAPEKRQMQAAFFGAAVATDGSGKIIAVGADGERNYTGAVYVFRENKNGSYALDDVLLREYGDAEDNFGAGVAVSRDGHAIVVGAPGVNEDRGEALLYKKEDSGNQWKIKDRVAIKDGKKGDLLGWSVALAEEHSKPVVLAGAPSSGNGQGVVAMSFWEGTWEKKTDVPKGMEKNDDKERCTMKDSEMEGGNTKCLGTKIKTRHEDLKKEDL